MDRQYNGQMEKWIDNTMAKWKKDIKDLTPVRGQDGKISDTQGKDFWSPTRLRLALLPVLDSFFH